MEAFNSKRSVSHPLMPSRSRYPPCENLINIGYIDPIHYARTASPTNLDVYRSPVFDFSRNYRPQVFMHQKSRSPRSNSPLASVENIHTPPSRSPRTPVLATSPLKVEEDVIVMDGILVKSPSSGTGGRGSRSPLDSGSVGRGSRAPLDSGSSPKTMSASWEETSTCLYNAKSQFAHGKEDPRPTQHSNKNKPEGQGCKMLTTELSGTYSTKSSFLHQAGAVNEAGTVQKIGQPNDITNWSPIDDGIVVRILSSSKNEYPGREAVNANINHILYGSRRRHRLAVFQEICPE